MKAALIDPQIPGSVRIEEIRKPDIQPRQTLVKVLEVGIDGTDLDINKGTYGEPPAGHKRLVITHENIGTIEAVGPEVLHLKPGDLVVSTVRRPCSLPECLNCRNGEPDMCLTGQYKERGIKGIDGYASDYYVEEGQYLVPIPASFRHVAVLLEPFSVAEKAIRQAFDVQRRMLWQPRRVFITGAGSLGLLVAYALRVRGLETWSLDIVPQNHPKALRLAEIGVHYINDRTTSLQQLASEVGMPDLIIETSGVSQILFQGLSVLSPNGILVSLGLSPSAQELSIPANTLNVKLVLNNNILLGSVSSSIRDFQQGVTDMQAGETRFPGWLGKLITRRLPFDKICEAFQRQPDDIKVIMEIAASSDVS